MGIFSFQRKQPASGSRDGWRKFAPSAARVLKAVAAVSTMLALAAGMNLVFYNSDSEINQIMNRPREGRYSIALNDNKATGINDAGDIVWQIESSVVTLSSNENQYEFHDAKARFFDSKGPNLYIEVKRILYDRKSQNLDLLGGVTMVTRDDMIVVSEEIHWLHYTNQFVFPKRVELRTKEGNMLAADYMHGDKDLRQLFFVGHCQIKVGELKDTKFIDERKLAGTRLKLEDFKDVYIFADKVYYDKSEEVMVATSPFSDKKYDVFDPRTGKAVVADYGKKGPSQVYFRKGEIELFANHVEVHLKDAWAKCYGAVDLAINPSKPKPEDDPALKAMRKKKTRIHANDVEYYWDADYARTYGRSIVVQNDRRAGAWGVTYYGKYEDPDTGQVRKVVFLDDDIFIYQSSGKWMKDENVLKDFKNPDVEQMAYEGLKVTGDRAVVYLDSADIYALGKVRIRQKDKLATCGEVFFDDTKKKFLCQDHVFYANKKDENFSGEQIIFYTDRDDIEVNGMADANIRIKYRYIKKFDDVKRNLAVQGAKGTSEEEEVKIREDAKQAERDANKPWEFLPGWVNAVLLPGKRGKGLRPLPSPPAESFTTEGIDWMAKLNAVDISQSPWGEETAGAQAPGSVAPGVPGAGALPEGEPMAPPQISGKSGAEAVGQKMRELGVGQGPPPGAPPGGEFVPPPLPGPESPGFQGNEGIDQLWKLKEKMEGQGKEAAPGGPPGESGHPPPQPPPTPPSDGNAGKKDPGEAIIIAPPKEAGK